MKKLIKISYLLTEDDKKSIKKQLIDLNLNYKKLSEILGISLAYIASILNGERRLTPEIKRKFEKVGIKLKKTKGE